MDGRTDRRTEAITMSLRFKKSVGLIYNLTVLDTCMHNGLSLVYCIKQESRIHYYTKG